MTDALIQFLAFMLGDYCTVYDKTEYERTPFNDYYKSFFKEQIKDKKTGRNQVTIIDMSLLLLS